MTSFKTASVAIALFVFFYTGSAVLARAQCPEATFVDTASGETMTPQAFIDRAGAVEIVLFGERHGIAEHVALAACLLQSDMALTLEHVPQNRQPASLPATVAGYFDAVGWEDLGWPQRAIYQPLIERGYALSLIIHGVDRPRRGEADDSLEAIRARAPGFGGDEEAIRAAWAPDMIANHCGMIDESVALRIAQAQMDKDRFMADGIVRAMGEGARVLFYGGKGHVRRDRGIGHLIAMNRPNLSLLTIGAYTREEYDALAPGTDLAARYDIIAVVGHTPPGESEPCAGFPAPATR